MYIREFELKYKVRKLEPSEIAEPYMRKVSDPKHVLAFFQDLPDKGIESFYVLYLNSGNKVLVKQRITEGTANQANPFIREVFRYALACDACGMIFVHNHPSGETEPSREDRAFTETATKLGDAMGIKILDHIIVGRDMVSGTVKHYSFSDHMLYL